MKSSFEEKKLRLKEIRNKFLRFHKILLDRERDNYEMEFGAVSAGNFLELLLGDERFAWLRTISTLIVRIDEAFDLDDGLSSEMVAGFYQESFDMIGNSDEYLEFKSNLKRALPHNPKAEVLKVEIEELLVR